MSTGGTGHNVPAISAGRPLNNSESSTDDQIRPLEDSVDAVSQIKRKRRHSQTATSSDPDDDSAVTTSTNTPSSENASTDSNRCNDQTRKPRQRSPRTRLTSVSPDREKSYTKLFHKLDTNHDGRIRAEDVKKLTPDPQHFMKLADTNEDGWIYIDEFIKYCHENEKRLNSLFDTIDDKNDGVIDAEELKRVLKKAGIIYTEDQVQKVFKELDTKGTNVIDRQEWVDKNLLVAADGDFYQRIFERAHGMEEQTGFQWFKFLYSFPGSCAAKTVTAPIDRVKIFFQVYSDQWHAGGKHAQRMSIRKCGSMLLQEGGVRGLFRGNMINVFKSMPENAIKLECNKYIRRLMKGENSRPTQTQWKEGDKSQKRNKLPFGYEVCAGGVSGLIAQTVMYPADTLKVRYALSRTGEFNSAMHATKSIYNTPTRLPMQWMNFYRGYLSSLGVIFYVAAELATYNSLQPFGRRFFNDYLNCPHWVSGTAVSFTAPAVGTIITYPLQLIRTRYQSDRRPKMGYTDFCKTILQRQGVRGFYTGLTPNLIKSVFSGGIILSWWTYVERQEKFKK